VPEVRRNRYEVSKPPKKKAFETKKQYERRVKAQETVEGYVHQGLQKAKPKRQTYQVKCGHCHGHKVMSNGRPCLNCGGSGTITRG
jgi:DnaJ-class molecular chaperone